MFTLRSNSVSLAGIVDRERERERELIFFNQAQKETRRGGERKKREKGKGTE